MRESRGALRKGRSHLPPNPAAAGHLVYGCGEFSSTTKLLDFASALLELGSYRFFEQLLDGGQR